MSKPIVLTKRQEMRDYVKEQQKLGNSIGFVPTMGALHAGHGALIAQSSAENKCTILSIFVNPLQFGPKEDFSKYPRTFAEDIALAEKMGATAIFSPLIGEVYPENFLSKVSVKEMTEVLCGEFRPGHFDGVTTVVMFFLNIVQADKAYFGMKDFQQLQIIKRMCEDLAHPTTIISCQTIREQDGLALSSRNRYLDTAGRSKATNIPLALATIAKEFLNGERSVDKLRTSASIILTKAGLVPQYLEFRLAGTLRPCMETITEPAVVAIAQPIEYAGGVCRLIDNVYLAEDNFAQKCLMDLINKVFG